ncbi:MAG: dihydroorotate dehydrogenase (quinone), partial [Candidatus Yanofskybacteria bacterium RIFCSPLOWO2_02_FULL_47_9b]
MRALTGILYRQVVKRILFLFSADSVHEFFLKTGRLFGRSGLVSGLIRALWRYDDPILEQSILGLKFKNPIGLSAGFDYNGDLVNLMPAVGFGFNTVGTLTHEAYAGNPAPMLGRLPKSRSLLVNKGFKNEGVTKVLSRIGDSTGDSVCGVSVGSTNKAYQSFDEMVDDIVAGFHDAEKFNSFDYYELNISCPNLTNLANLKEKLALPSGLAKALEKLSELNIKRPVFIKMPLERTVEEMTELAEVARPFAFIKGLVFSNLAKDRTNPAFDKEEIARAGAGNFSGKPVEAGSNDALRHIYAKFGNRFVLIGVGGVFDAADAYKKIRLGASLVQLITGMVYVGPQQIGVINQGLAELLRRDGYRSVGEAVGTLTRGGGSCI